MVNFHTSLLYRDIIVDTYNQCKMYIRDPLYSRDVNWPLTSIKINGCVISDHLAGILTHWGRVTHICVSKLASIVSGNGFSPGRRQAIIWTNAGMFLIGPLGTIVNEILIEIHTFSFKKMHFNMSSGKWLSGCCIYSPSFEIQNYICGKQAISPDIIGDSRSAVMIADPC